MVAQSVAIFKQLSSDTAGTADTADIADINALSSSSSSSDLSDAFVPKPLPTNN